MKKTLLFITIICGISQLNALVYDIYNKSDKNYKITLVPNSSGKPSGSFDIAAGASLPGVFYNTSYGDARTGVTSWGVKQIKVMDKATGQTFVTPVAKDKQNKNLKISLFYNATQEEADLARQPVGIWLQYSVKK